MALRLPALFSKSDLTPPGPRGFPLVGHLPLLAQYKHQYQALDAIAQDYGNLYKIRIGTRSVIVLSGLETLRQALIKQSTDFAGRPGLYTLQTVIDGRTMGGRDYGPLYRRHREITAGAMHTVMGNGGMAKLEQQIIDESRDLSDRFLSYQGQPFDPKMDLGLAIAGVMFKFLFSDPNCRENPDCVDLVKYATNFAANTVGSLIVDFMPQLRFICTPGLNKFFEATQTMERLILGKLKTHRETYRPDQVRDVVDALMKAAGQLTDSEQALGLNESVLVEGTTQELMGTGLQPLYPLVRWAMLYMVVYPHVQRRVQAELDQTLAEGAPVTLSDRSRLPYTQACLYEIMRHCPMFPLTIPHSTTQDTQLNGYHLPKDTMVLINLYSLTRDPRFFESPEQFRPSRFLDSEGQIKEDLLDKFYPFGLGKRRCSGEHLGRMELFLLFGNLLQRCQLTSVTDTPPVLEGIPGTMLHPEDYQIIARDRRQPFSADPVSTADRQLIAETAS